MEALLKLFAENQNARLHEMVRLMGNFDALRSQDVSKRDPHFNLFSVLGFGSNEVALSSLLAWLLNEHGSHGQGNLFLKEFVKLCGFQIPLESMHRYRVVKEYCRNESIIDVMIYKKPSFLIYVENKIHAPEGKDQTAREFNDMRQVGSRMQIPEECQYAVFLTPSGHQPNQHNGSQWHTLSHSDLASTFMNSDVVDLKLRHLLNDYCEMGLKWSINYETDE
jgi:hypothetical protein